MKYFNKFLIFIFLVFLSGASWSQSKIENCSEIVGGVYVQKTCTTNRTEIARYSIIGLPNELSRTLNIQTLNEAINVSGKWIVFHEKNKTTSIFPPQKTKVVWRITFANNSFKVDNTTSHENDLSLAVIFIMMTIVTIISGVTGDNELNPIRRHSTVGIIAGITSSLIFGWYFDLWTGMLAGMFTGVFAGGLANGFNGVFPGVITGMLAGMFTGVLTAIFVVGSGLTAPVKLEWLGFCLLLIAVEYIIVFYRRHRGKTTTLSKI